MAKGRILCVKVVGIWGTPNKDFDQVHFRSRLSIEFRCRGLGFQSKQTSYAFGIDLPQFNEELYFNLPDSLSDLLPATLSASWGFMDGGFTDLHTKRVDLEKFVRKQLVQGNDGADESFLKFNYPGESVLKLNHPDESVLKLNRPFYQRRRYAQLKLSIINPYRYNAACMTSHEIDELFGSYDNIRELKKKQLMETRSITALCGSWGKTTESNYFHAYEIKLSGEERLSSFVLLLGTKLDDDVENIKFDVTLVSKIVECSILYGGEIFVDADHMEKGKRFHELLFNAMFGEIFISLSGKLELLFLTEQCLWENSNLYLILPMDTSTSTLGVNWTEVESCNYVVDFLKENVYAWLTAESSEKRKSLFDDRDIFDTTLLHFANKSVRRTDVNGMAVMTILTGRIYHIEDVTDNSPSERLFQENADGNPISDYDYFNKEYGISLLFPRQPLLVLKRNDHPHNDFKEGTKYPETIIFMPPELLVWIDLRTEILKSFYLLPWVMHKLESLMLASQFREEITSHSANLQISTSLILEALTSRRCNENFSMERLKVLGESVLNCVLRCDFFLHYPRRNAEDLSRCHSKADFNSSMCYLGNLKLKGYIRDSQFDPLRWTAPGQRSITVSPCDHGVEPLNYIYSEDPLHVIGISCINGHRWISIKTIIDCAEALIGAFYSVGGLVSVVSLLKWFEWNVKLEPNLVKEVIENASPPCCVQENDDIEILELKIGYSFRVKRFLSEAITLINRTAMGKMLWITGEHYFSKQHERFKRFAYLGEAVMDVLITQHLYENLSDSDIDPNHLEYLRSIFSDKVNFAHAIVRRNLYPYIHQHGSESFMSRIQTFVRDVNNYDAFVRDVIYHDMRSPPSKDCPEVLGTLVESIAGAILIDSKFSLEEVWRVFKPILSPMNPDEFELQPMRELSKLCESLGCLLQINNTAKGDMVHAEFKLRLKDASLISEGHGKNRKAAKGQAALKLLKQLENRGISSRNKPKPESDNLVLTRPKVYIPVISHIPQKKRGPRRSLFKLCEEMHWRLPRFQISREPIEPLEEGVGLSYCFKSHISLVTGFGSLELDGEKQSCKKTAHDSAALVLLVELERQGRIEIMKW